MARARSPDRDKAFEIYKEHEGKIELVEIANILDRPEGTIRGWKNKDQWDNKLNGTFQKNKRNAPKEKNQSQHKQTQINRSGNPNPKNQFTKRNREAETHGLFTKYLPDETLELMEGIKDKSPIDILWDQIMIQYAAIIRAQKIMYVKDQEDITKVLRKHKHHEGLTSTTDEKEWEFQMAWDKHATFLQAQSRAMSELRSMIKRYEEMLQSDLATEEQKLRIEKLKVDIEKVKDTDTDKPIEIVIKRKGED